MNTAISKIFKTILIMFIIITIYTIPISQKNNNNVLRTNLEISEITGINTNKVYLLNKDNLLVQTEMFNDAKEEKQIKNIINYLTITNNKTPKGLKSYIPKNANLQSIKKENNNLFIDFSKELLESDNIDLIIKGIVYSLIDISGIENIHLTVDKKTKALLSIFLYISSNLFISKISPSNFFFIKSNNLSFVFFPSKVYLLPFIIKIIVG